MRRKEALFAVRGGVVGAVSELAVVLMCLLCWCGIVACGNGVEESREDSDEIVGKWKMISPSRYPFFYIFDRDGEFAALEDGDIDGTGTYRVSGNILTLTHGNDVWSWSISIIGDVMIIDTKEQGDGRLVFERIVGDIS